MAHDSIIPGFWVIRSKHKCPQMGLIGGNENYNCYIVKL